MKLIVCICAEDKYALGFAFGCLIAIRKSTQWQNVEIMSGTGVGAMLLHPAWEIDKLQQWCSSNQDLRIMWKTLFNGKTLARSWAESLNLGVLPNHTGLRLFNAYKDGMLVCYTNDPAPPKHTESQALIIQKLETSPDQTLKMLSECTAPLAWNNYNAMHVDPFAQQAVDDYYMLHQYPRQETARCLLLIDGFSGSKSFFDSPTEIQHRCRRTYETLLGEEGVHRDHPRAYVNSIATCWRWLDTPLEQGAAPCAFERWLAYLRMFHNEQQHMEAVDTTGWKHFVNWGFLVGMKAFRLEIPGENDFETLLPFPEAIIALPRHIPNPLHFMFPQQHWPTVAEVKETVPP